MPYPPAFLTESQMEGIREVALMGMTTKVSIERRSEAAPPVGGDYGDDFLDYTQTTESRRDVRGWFYSQPAPMQEPDSGMVITVTTYRLFLPVGTDVMVGDLVHVGEDVYVVSDTTREGTWLPLLTCSLRKAE